MIKWRSQFDQDIYNNILIPVLRDRPTTVFVGAGLSFHAGCPLLDELIETLHTAAINHTGKELILNGDWKEKAQICKRELGVANFNQILIDKFNPENRRLNFTSLHTSLIQIPFKSIVTTNFDSCIELADRDSKIWRTFYYPNLNVIELGNKSIQHIHGYIDPENPNGTVGSIILTSEDFIEAYRDNPGSVKRFLVDLFSLHNVIFLGFNLGDETLMEILEIVKQGRGEKQQIAKSRQLPSISETVHFAILENPTEVRIDGKLLGDQNEKERIIRDQDVTLQYLGVHPIRYAWDENYKSVENIIDDMKALTSVLDLKRSEAGDLI